MKHGVRILIFAFSCTFTANAQDLELKQVDFYQPCRMTETGCQTSIDGWINIADESAQPVSPYNNPPLISGATKTTAWTSNGVTKPIAYVSGYRARVSASFSFSKTGDAPVINDCGICKSLIYVRGRWLASAPGNDPIIVVKPTVVSGTGSLRTIGPVHFESQGLFQQGLVRYIENFQIQWEYAFDSLAPPSAWKIAGSSAHPLYITHSIPAKSPYSLPSFFRSTLHRGCFAANGFSTPEFIADATYAQFEDQIVERAYETQGMKYWGPKAYFNAQNQWVFLYDRDGRCGSWAQFLSDLLRLHGIRENLSNEGNEVTTSDASTQKPYEGVPITVTAYNFGIVGADRILTGIVPETERQYLFDKIGDYFGNLFDPNDPYNTDNSVYLDGNAPSNSIYSYFFVKNWNIGENNLYLDAPLPAQITTPGNPPYDRIFGANSAGLPAQSNLDPQSVFNNHAIYKYSGGFFDPSYGSSIVTDKNVWTENALSGIGSLIRYRNSMNQIRDIYWVHKNSNFFNEIKFTIK